MSRRRAIVRHDVRTPSAPLGVARIEQYVDLDEVVIPGRVHVEDMGGGYWCVILGDGDLTVSVGPRGVTITDYSPSVRGLPSAPAAPPPPSKGG